MQTFLYLLQQSSEPRIVNVSSSQGSLNLHSDPTYKYNHRKGVIYQSSKSALNMYTIALAYELRETNFKVNAVSHPSIATDFNRHLGTSKVGGGAQHILTYTQIFIFRSTLSVFFHKAVSKTESQRHVTLIYYSIKMPFYIARVFGVQHPVFGQHE
jgi:NAD(P)-dependent dehydrogenase (short-subunit alcohol dehydrogenase family)